MPEASASDILDDVRDFWHWLHDTFPTLTTDWNAVPDLGRLACTGQSAGSYLAVQSALLFSDLSQIKVLASMGGSLNTNIPECRIPGPRIILGKKPPPPAKAESTVRKYVKAIQPQTVRTSGDVMEMWNFLTCVLQQASLARWVGAEKKDELDVMKVLEKAQTLPPSKSIRAKIESEMSWSSRRRPIQGSLPADSLLTHISLSIQNHDKKLPLHYHNNSLPILIDTRI